MSAAAEPTRSDSLMAFRGDCVCRGKKKQTSDESWGREGERKEAESEKTGAGLSGTKAEPHAAEEEEVEDENRGKQSKRIREIPR